MVKKKQPQKRKPQPTGSREVPLGKPCETGHEIPEIKSVVESGWWAGCGPKTKQLEDAVKEALELPPAYKVLAVSSGTMALHMCATYCLSNYDRRPVICPSYTFIATAISHHPRRRGDLVMCDIELDDCNTSARLLENAWNTFTSSLGMGSFPPVFLPVHQYGIPLDIGPITKLVQRYEGSFVVEDAACALGSRYPDGKFVGHSGNLVCFSMHPRKVFTAGEGGLIVIPPHIDSGWFEEYRNFGLTSTPFSQHGRVTYMEPDANIIGFNCKMSEFQAAIGLTQVESMKQQMLLRQLTWHEYDDKLKPLGLQVLTPPKKSIWNVQNYRVLFKDKTTRDGVRDHLRNNGIAAKNTIRPLDQFACLKHFPLGHSCVNAKSVYERGLWLPIYTEILSSDITYVVDKIKEAL